MTASLIRIRAMFFRYLYLHQRSVSRVLELIFWPVMELLVWGFVSVYIQSVSSDPAVKVGSFLITGMIFWDVLYRSQQGVTISFIEDIWTHNILNILISPLKLWEWLAATFIYGLAKTLLITVILCGIAAGLYHFDLVGKMGFYFIPLMANLLFFGWTMGVFTSGLLMRWGHAVEALIWGIPFIIQPISAIFYPLEVLPKWVQAISVCLPSTHVFEGARFVLQTGQMPLKAFGYAVLLNFVYFALASLFFRMMYHRSRSSGRLGRLGMD